MGSRHRRRSEALRLPAALAVLRNRDFRLYWSGQAVSLIGTWMQIMAQAWVITSLSRSVSILGALNVVGSFPILMLSLLGGRLADRFEKRRILILTQIAMMFLAFAFAILVFGGHIVLWQIFVLAFLLGVATAFDLPAAQALPPELVERREIPAAVALMQSIFHGSRLIGPALAGILVTQFGAGSAFLANGVSYLAVIASLLAIRGAQARCAGRGGTAGRSGTIREGLRYVRSEPTVRALIVLTGLTTALVFPFIVVLMVFFVKHVLQTSAEGMGAIMSASGFGSLVGALVLLGGSPARRAHWILGGVLGTCAGLFALSFARSLHFAVPIVMVLSFSVSSLLGRIAQTVQERVPGELRGRVMGTFSMSFTGLMPYSSLGLAFAADAIGYQAVMRLAALAYGVLTLAVLSGARGAIAGAATPAGEIQSQRC